MTACGAASSADTAPTARDPLVATLAFEISERPWDLAAHPDGRILCTAQAGGKIYAWDPATADRDELTDDLSEIQALALSGEDIFITTSDNGVTGALARWDGQDVTVLSTQADDGTLLRWPVDLIDDGEGGWLMADAGAGMVFHADAAGGVTALATEGGAPVALLLEGGRLYVGQEEGIWATDWPGWSLEQVDARAGLGLLAVEGDVWAANAADHLFAVGGALLGVEQPARPGSLALSDGVVYVADQVGQGIWAVSP